MPVLRSSYIASIFVSGAVHASAVGLAVWGLTSGFIGPGYGLQSGGASGSGGTVWSPSIDSPFDFGELAALKGDDGELDGLKISVVDPLAVAILALDAVEEITFATPPAAPQREVVATPPVFEAAQPVRLDEPNVEPLQQTQAESIETVSKTPELTAVGVTAKRLTVAIDSPPEPEERRPSNQTESEPEKGTEPTKSTESEKGTVATKRAGTAEAGRVVGDSQGQATQAVASAASVPSPASGLPPGAKADVAARTLPQNPAPPYPAAAYQLGQQGVVQLLVTVSEQGTVATLRVFKTSGFAELDEAALKAVREWKFQPATYRGQPVSSRVVIPIGFKIQD